MPSEAMGCLWDGLGCVVVWLGVLWWAWWWIKVLNDGSEWLIRVDSKVNAGEMMDNELFTMVK